MKRRSEVGRSYPQVKSAYYSHGSPPPRRSDPLSHRSPRYSRRRSPPHPSELHAHHMSLRVASRRHRSPLEPVRHKHRLPSPRYDHHHHHHHHSISPRRHRSSWSPHGRSVRHPPPPSNRSPPPKWSERHSRSYRSEEGHHVSSRSYRTHDRDPSGRHSESYRLVVVRDSESHDHRDNRPNSRVAKNGSMAGLADKSPVFSRSMAASKEMESSRGEYRKRRRREKSYSSDTDQLEKPQQRKTAKLVIDLYMYTMTMHVLITL